MKFSTHIWKALRFGAIILVALKCLSQGMAAVPSVPGDLDGDGLHTVLDLVVMLNHIDGTSRLSNEASVFADLNQDGIVNDADVDLLVDVILGISIVTDLPLTHILETSPAAGESGVSVTRETIIRFTQPLANTVLTVQKFYAEFGGRRLLSRVDLSPDHRKATLFYQENLPGLDTFVATNLPGSARVNVTFDGTGIKDFLGRLIDADGDGLPGGIARFSFDTLNQTPLAHTIVCGRVFASELAVGTNSGTNMSVNVPLQGVTVTADGLEQSVRAVSDQYGNFRFTNAPGGQFFVHIDGRTVTNLATGIRYPDKAYYPFVGKLWESVPGGETNIGEVYLPLIAATTLQSVSSTQSTVITFPTNVLADHPELTGVTVTVPANALFSDGGTRGGRVGIAPVPPDRLPGALPLGLEFALVITVQTDGAQNFSEPVPVCFPNLPNPVTGVKLSPGAKTALWSFDHDLGIWVIRGSMTVSADGTLACSDPGVGLLSPGWHGINPGTGCGGPDCVTPSSNPNPNPPPPKIPPPVNSQYSCPADANPTDPVNLYSGELFESVEDWRIKGVGLDFVWHRTYRSYGSEGRLGKAANNGVEYVSSAAAALRASVRSRATSDIDPTIAYLAPTPLGKGWDHSYNIWLHVGVFQNSALSNATDIALFDGEGRKDTYFRRDDGTWTVLGFFRVFTANPDGTLTLTFEDQTKWNFEVLGKVGRISSIVDRNGNHMRFTYDDRNLLIKITDTLGRDITLAYDDSFNFGDGDPRLVAVTDFAGRTLRYDYFPSFPDSTRGLLRSVTLPAVTGMPNGNDFPNGKTTTYTYTADEQKLATITDARGNKILENTYTTNTSPSNPDWGAVVRQVWGGDVVDIAYIRQTPAPENNNAVVKTIVNDRNGNVKEYFYDGGNRCTMMREYTGRANPTQPTTETANRAVNKLRATDPDYFETRYEYNSDYKRTRTIYPNGDITENIYGADMNPAVSARFRGNLIETRHTPGSHVPAGDQSLLVEKFEYATDFAGCCGFNFVTKHTDSRGNITLSQYDPSGNIIARTNKLDSIVDRWEYNSRGQVTKHTLPDNGAGSHRVDAMTYYESGPQFGYLKDEIIDFDHFKLTTTFEHDAVGNVVRKTDPRGHDTQYIVNQLNQVVRELSPEVTTGSGIRYQRDFFYDANNNLARLDVQNRDENGVVQTNATFTTTYEYEVLNNLIRTTQEVDATHNVVTEYAYDGNRNRILTRHGEATAGRQPNDVVQMLYDERDLLFREIRAPGGPDQSTTQFDYDGNHNRIRQWQGLEDAPRLTTYLYDGFNRLVSMLDPMGNVATNQYDPNGNRTRTVAFGELIDVAGWANNVRLSETVFDYDALNRLTNQAVVFFNAADQSPIGDGSAVTQTVYSDDSQVLAIINDNGHGATNRYDTANRLRTRTDAKGNTVTYDYDADSNVLIMSEVEKPDLGGPDERFGTTNTYDNLNRPIATTDNVGNVNRAAYDSRNNRTLTTDALTNRVLYAFDGLNRLLRTTRLLTDSGVGSGAVVGQIVTRQTWDDSSRLTSQIDDNGNDTTYVFDGLNRKVVTVFADGTGQTNVFNPHHNAIQFADGNGNIVTSAYDAGDRLTRRDIVCGPGVVTNTTFEVFQYDGLGRLVLAQDNGSLVTRRYDSLSHMVAEVQNGQTVFSIYDGVGNVTRIVYPNGRVVTQTFDALEQLKTTADNAGASAAYAYTGPSRVVRRDYGNGTRTAYSYDGISSVTNGVGDHGVRRMVRTKHTKISGGTVLDDRTFTWDAMGNKTGLQELAGLSRARSFSYDSAYRLRHSVATPSTGPPQAVDYLLDGVGNRQNVTGGSDSGNYTLSAVLPEPADFQLNQYTATPFDSRRSDKNGNLSALNAGLPAEKTLLFDYRDRLVGFTNREAGVSARYAYDALGRRISKTVHAGTTDTIRFLYHGLRVCEEQNQNGTELATYLFGHFIDEALAMRRGGLNFYYHSDDLYNVCAISDQTGTVFERCEYDDYGAALFFTPADSQIVQSALLNPLLFNGRYFDSESSFYDYRARYLDPLSGRFISRDAIGIWGDPSSLGNCIVYAANNPRSLLDPYGLQVFIGELPPFIPPFLGEIPPEPILPPGCGRIGTGPKPSPKFEPPTNEPQMPPTEVPPGWRTRRMPPTEQYPDGYWKLEKPMNDGSWQPIDPSTMKPGTHPQTHVPFPRTA